MDLTKRAWRSNVLPAVHRILFSEGDHAGLRSFAVEPAGESGLGDGEQAGRTGARGDAVRVTRDVIRQENVEGRALLIPVPS